MTPFKSRQMSINYNDDDLMVPSPPRDRTSQLKLPSTNLFGDDNINTSSPIKSPDNRQVTFRKKTTTGFGPNKANVLRPLNINSFTPSSNNRHRKRPSNNTYGGKSQGGGLFMDSDEDMFHSPKTSPNEYRTLDGRTVTSKNPFSPYTPADESMDYSDSPMQRSVPAFPEGPMSSNTSIMLPQRTPFKQTYFGPSDNGFPDQGGQYSYTGSPIKEIDNTFLQPFTEVRNKVRRLRLQDNATRRTPFIDTERANEQTMNHKSAKVSPTDIFSFPSPPTPAFPTPAKSVQPSFYSQLRPPGTGPAPGPPQSFYSQLRPSTGSTNPPQSFYSQLRPSIGSTGPPQSFYSQLRPSIGSGPPPTPNLRRHQMRDEDNEDDSISKLKSRFNQDFDIINQLGGGSFGTVYQCLSRLDGCMYAIKAAKRKAKGAADRDRMLKEVYALAALSNQADTAAFHIVRYHQAWMEENRLYIQTELCSFTLDDEIKKGSITEKRRYKLLREILLALELIHRNGMVHLDIKPENIFVKNDQYKLGDFGLVSKAGDNKDVEEGDSRYMSMELLNARDCNDLTKSDIFSMGVTMYQICSGREPPMNGQEWRDIRSASLRPFQDTPLEMEMIVREMMDPEPSQRPKASELLKKDELLSEEQRLLNIEKRKVAQAKMDLALQTQKINSKGITKTKKKPTLGRANTWNF